MTKTQHTPGPWGIDATDRQNVLGQDGKRIAACETFDRSPDETGANARLIAAAPDMLDVLQRYLGRMIRAGWPDEEVSEVRDVIAKATQE